MTTTATAAQHPEPRRPGLLGSSAVMAAGTVVSRLTGFARAAVIAAAIGLTAVTADVFNVPNVIPNMIYILVGGGVLNSVLVPVLVRAIKNDADGGEAFSQRLFSIVVTLLGVTTVVAVLGAEWIMRVIVDDRFLEPANRAFFDNMVMFARFCLPQIFFYGLYVLVGQMLNAKGRFGPMMWSPILNNIVAIIVFGAYIVTLGPKDPEPFTTTETLLLGLGSTLGVVAQALVLLPVLRRAGFSLRFRTDWRGQGLGESVRLGLWTFGFVVVNQLAYLVVVNVASGASSLDGSGDGGGYSVYANAMLIMMVPHSVVTVSLATALLPRLADLASEGDLAEVRAKLASAIRMCLTVIVPLGALVVALAFPLTAVIFDHGSASGQTQTLAMTLIALMPGLAAFTVHYLALRGFYAVKDTRTPFFTQIWVSATMIAAAVVTAAIAPADQYVTLALATGYSLAYLVGSIVGLHRLQHRVGPVGGARLVQHLVRLLVHSTVAATVAWLVWRGWTALGLLDGAPSMIGRIVELVIGGTVGVATFVGLAYAFRIAEVRAAIGMVSSKLRGRGAQPEAVTDPADLLEDTAEYVQPFETGTLSIFRRPIDPDMTSEFFLDETLPGVPSFFDTSVGRHRASGSARRVDPGGSIAAGAGPHASATANLGGAPLSAPPAWTGPDGTDRPATIGGRYHLERLLDDSDGVQCWHAFDEVLRRAVFIQCVAADDPRAEGFVTAARISSTLGDSRFLRVLDVGVDRVAYLVREWTPGQNLGELLVDGPFHPHQAAVVAREVADALTVAHALGLAHRRLDPTMVFVTSDGSVKIAGVEIEYALRGAAPAPVPVPSPWPARPNPAQLDAMGIGAILYAGLTSRWPGGQRGGLAAAPVVDGRLALPRQVRPGVPSGLDAIADRCLNQVRRDHATPLTTPAAVAAELAAAVRTAPPLATGAGGPPDRPPAVLGDPAQPPPMSRSEQRRQRRKSGRTARLLGVLAATLLLVGMTLVGLQLLLGAIDDISSAGRQPEATTTSPREPTVEPTPLAIVEAKDYDPPEELGGGGNGEERPRDVGLAFDGDPETAWSTVTYFDEMERQKPGVGLFFDLGDPVEVREVQLILLSADTAFELRAAPAEAVEAPAHLDDWAVVDQVESAEQTVTRTLAEPVTTRYVLVWFTRLPLLDGDFRGGIAEAEVRG